jgi:hypothetical protein
MTPVQFKVSLRRINTNKVLKMMQGRGQDKSISQTRAAVKINICEVYGDDGSHKLKDET